MSDKPDMKEVHRVIRKAKLTLMLQKKTTFFSALLTNLKLIVDETKPTAATDGVNLWFNPNFVLEQDADQLLGLTLHETMHVVYDDMGRRIEMELNPEIWNMACDHRINLYLLAKGYSLPDGGIADTKYTGWSAKKIYEDLLQDPPPQSLTYAMDIISGPGDAASNEEKLAHREQVISNVVKAVQQATLMGDPGSVPGHVARRLDDILNPKLPWYQILLNHVEQHAREDYSRGRPNRRYLQEDIYLPSLKSEQLKQMTVASDVSASMSNKDISLLMAEVRYIWDILKPKSLRLISFDTEVHDDDMFEEGDYFGDLTLHGGGGTDVLPIIEGLKKDQPELAIIFSDGYFYMPSLSGITSDLLWIIKGNPNFTAPYGVVIHYDEYE